MRRCERWRCAPPRRSSPRWRALGVLLVAGVCLGAVSTAGAGPAEVGSLRPVARPQTGGTLTYGVDSEPPGGWCLPDVDLGTGGAEVAQAVYETLTVPNAAGELVPYLARSVDHAPDFTEWTISLRDGIQFHDGTPLDASAVVQNLDAYRQGSRSGVSLSDIAAVEATDGMTVRVTTRVPWVTFPAFLWANGRLGMMAPAQIADRSTCSTNLIGTGPFELRDWVPGEHVDVVRNDRYWQQDPSGRALPYLDAIRFRPVGDTAQRLNGLKGRDLDIIQLTNGQWMTDLRKDAEGGFLRLLESDRAPGVSHIMLNVSAPPFAHRSCRLALAHATDNVELSQLGDELGTPADQPFAPRTLGHQPAPGAPRFDPERSRELVDRCVRALGTDTLRFALSTTPDAETQALAGAVYAQLDAVDVQVDVTEPLGPGDLRERVAAGDYQATLWTNPPALDPDALFGWWHSTTRDPATGERVRNPLNLGRFEDPTIDRALERARSDDDQSDRASAYEQVGRQFAKEGYVVWVQYVEWVFAARPDLGGLAGPRLPNGDRRGPPPAGVQPVLGLWLER